MSRSRKNKYDSEKDVTLKRMDIKAYSDEDAFPVYIPSQNVAGKEKKKKKKVLLILLLIFLMLIFGAGGAFTSSWISLPSADRTMG